MSVSEHNINSNALAVLALLDMIGGTLYGRGVAPYNVFNQVGNHFARPNVFYISYELKLP